MAAAVLVIDINARLASLEAGLAKTTSAVRSSSRNIENSLTGISSKLKTYAITAAGAFGVPLGVAGLVSALSSIKEQTSQGERALNQLDAVIKLTGSSAGLTKKEITDLGKEIESKTVFDDDAINQAATSLLRFRTIQGDTFKDALRLAPSVASVLGKTLPDAAEALGRAMTSEGVAGMKAFRQAGVQLDDKLIDLADRMDEAGNKAGAQRIKFDAIAAAIGGASEADTKGIYGSVQRLTRAWEDLQKAVGRKLFADQGPADFATKSMDKLTEAIDKSKNSWVDFLNIVSAPLRPGSAIGMFIGSQAATPQRRAGVSGKISGDANFAEDAEKAKALAAQAEQEAKQRANQSYEDQKAALKKAADNAESYYNHEFAILKASLDARQQALDFSYQQNEISSTEYYASERALAEENSALQIQFLTKQAQAQLKLKDPLQGVPPSRDEVAGADARLDAIAQKLNASSAERAKTLADINRKQIVAVQNLSDEYEDLNAALLQVSGSTVEAANAFAAAHRDQVRRLSAEATSDDPAVRGQAQASLERIRLIGIAVDEQARLTEATATYGRMLDEVARAESRIAIAVSSGSLTELEGLRALSDLRAQKVQQLQKELDVQIQIAATLAAGPKRDEALATIDAMKVKLEELAATGDLVARKFNEIGQGVFGDALTALITGEKSLKQAALDASKQLAGSISRVVSDNLAQMAFGKGGPLSGFGDFFSKMLGGKGAGETATAASGAAALTGAGTSLTGAGASLTAAGTEHIIAAGALASAAAALSASAAASGGSNALSGFAGLGSKIYGSGGGGGEFGTFESSGGFGAGEYFGGSYASGMPYVPRDALYTLHRGERVVTADRNRNWGERMRNRTADYGRQERSVVFQVYPPAGMSTQTARQRGREMAERATFELRRG